MKNKVDAAILKWLAPYMQDPNFFGSNFDTYPSGHGYYLFTGTVLVSKNVFQKLLGPGQQNCSTEIRLEMGDRNSIIIFGIQHLDDVGDDFFLALSNSDSVYKLHQEYVVVSQMVSRTTLPDNAIFIYNGQLPSGYFPPNTTCGEIRKRMSDIKSKLIQISSKL
jgi:hypothetical protein